MYTFSDYQDASLSYPFNQQYSDKYSPEAVIPHPSGMVFIQDFANISVIDPTGVQPTTMISLPIPPTSDPRQGAVGKMIVAGDGNAYIPYLIANPGPTYTANVMRVSSDGTYTPIQLGSSPTSFSTPIAITNADQGVAVFTRRTAPTTTHLDIYYASQSGPTSQVLDAAVFPSDGSGPFQFTPALQRGDGSYIGTDGGQNYIVALGSGGGILWQQQLGSFLQGNNVPVKPLYATADGGVIFTTSPSAYDCAGGDFVAGATPGCQYSLSANPYSRGLLPTDAGYTQLATLVILDQNGNPAVDQNGSPIPPAADTGALFSWTGEWYSSAGSSVSAVSPSISLTVDQASLWSVTGGNPTGNGVAIPQCPCLLQSIGGSLPLGQVEVPQARLSPRVLAQPSPPVGCLICTLTPPTQTQTPDEPTCAVFVGTGPTYLILVGDQGLPPHDVGDGFNLAAQTEANILKAQGNYVAACRVSSLQNVLNALTKFGAINGGVIYFGHLGPFSFHLGSTFLGNMSILAVGQASGTDTNISYKNSQQLAVVQTALNGNQNILGSHAAILLNGCRAAEDVHDYALSTASIAQLVAQSTQRGVYGYRVGMYFSLNDVANATSWNYAQEPNPVPEVLPLYLVPEGRPQHKPQPTLCTPQGGCQK